LPYNVHEKEKASQSAVLAARRKIYTTLPTISGWRFDSSHQMIDEALIEEARELAKELAG